MFYRLNNKLRKIIAVAGGIFLLLTLIAKTKNEVDEDDGFQTKEFDDIW